MDPTLLFIRDLIVLAVLVCISSLFVAVEFSILKSRITVLVEESEKRKLGTDLALSVLRSGERGTLVAQFGALLCAMLLGWWGVDVLTFHFKAHPDVFGNKFLVLSNESLVVVLSFITIIYVLMVFAWLLAKSVASLYPERTLRLLSAPLLVFGFISSPLMFIVAKSGKLILKLFNLEASVDVSRVHTPEEIVELVTQSTESGELNKEEESMLHGVIGLSNTVAREIMTPRTDLNTIPSNATLEEVVSIVVDSGYSRIPVVDGSIDNVLGILLVRDLMPYFAVASNPNAREQVGFDVRKLVREPYFIPGTKPVDELLKEFKRRKTHMAIVFDEHGGVDGVVTLEDLLEEIVGDIYDESDIPENQVEVSSDGDIVVDGGVLVADLNARFDLNIPQGEYDTIAGFVLSAFGRLPKVGDSVNICGGRIFCGSYEENGAENTFESYIQVDSEQETKDDLEGQHVVKTVILVEKVDGFRVENVRIRLNQSQISEESKSQESAS